MNLLHFLAPAPPAKTVAPLDVAALVGADGWARLPHAVRRRFAAAHHDATYEGELALDCSPLGRWIALGTRVLGGPLTGLRGSLPARVRVYDDGHGGVVWERRLRVAGAVAPRIVRSTKLAGPAGTLVERTDGGLAMELAVFEERGALVFESRAFFLALGAWRLVIPRWLTPGVCRVEHHDLGAGRFRFTLSMVHPRWGRTFHQTGIFHDPQEASA
jgi:hypothetical protein